MILKSITGVLIGMSYGLLVGALMFLLTRIGRDPAHPGPLIPDANEMARLVTVMAALITGVGGALVGLSGTGKARRWEAGRTLGPCSTTFYSLRRLPMSLRRSFGIGLLALACAACGGGGSGPPTAGEMKDFSSACDKDNDGKRIAVVGYLRFPEKFTGTQSVVLRLYEGPDYVGAPVGVQTTIGQQANQAELAPKQYTDKDLKVHTADGQVASYGTKVRVSGKVYFPLVGQDFKCALENPLIELAR